MKFSNSGSSSYVPDSTPLPSAISRTTHLGVGAHQDDLEFMAFHGILECFHQPEKWFCGITCSDGAGSSRLGPYADYSDEEMKAVRHAEQDTAAKIGEFGAMIQLNHPSKVIKDSADKMLESDLLNILEQAKPEVVYTHNLADKHDTHIGVTVSLIKALRQLPAEKRPRQVIGCEVWRNLDRLADDQKVVMDVSSRDNLAAALNGVFDSQIAGGKRYDLATAGRRAANATFFDSHSSDDASQLIFGLDLTPLITDPTLDIADYAASFIQQFEQQVRSAISNQLN